MKARNRNWYKAIAKILVFSGLILLLGACNDQSRGFALPEGDAVIGKAYFTDLNCNSCHSIGDIEWLGEGGQAIPLGGKTTRVKSYGNLVTSVINPSHKISKLYLDVVDSTGNSRMTNYNEAITVQELIDIVAFLQSEYEIVTPDYSHHYPY